MPAGSQKCLEDLKKYADERITLNVGGVKYETCRATLTKYPETMLGTMFHQRNKVLLHPIKKNEHFIDRDGHIFRYILQFYRTGKIPTPDQVFGLVPISAQELDAELDYYMIPRPKPKESPPQPPPSKQSIRHKMIGIEIDNFVAALKDVIHLLSVNFYEEFLVNRSFEAAVEMTYHKSAQLRLRIDAPPSDIAIEPRVRKILESFSTVGYLLLEKFGSDIGKYLLATVPGASWDLKEQVKIIDPSSSLKLYDLRISLKDTMDHEAILRNTCLGQTEFPEHITHELLS